jgi:endonuclease/exonuclease/phosphatase family metal-dependent hydrolase
LFGLALVMGLEGAASAAAADGRKGTFELLTYNVAGLPEGISNSSPLANLPLIGKLLNKYDIALVQEDFAYPLELRQKVRHGHASPAFVRGNRLDFGDGLSQFARLPFSGFRRVPWLSCHGVFDSFFDCLTPKGFTVARQSLAEGVFLDVYNLHMDAGWSSGDRAARQKQVAQLIAAIRRESAGHALIVGGDTNILRKDEGLLEQLLTEAQLKDACSEARCSEPGRIDRVLYRSSPELMLAVRKWQVDPAFVDARGRPLSDHLPVAVAFDWERRLDTSRSASRATRSGPRGAGTRQPAQASVQAVLQRAEPGQR